MSEKQAQLKEDVLELATKIEAGLTMDKKSGVATASEDLYEQNLPEDLTMEEVKKVSDYNTTFVAAGTYAFGKLSVDAMSGNKGLEKTTGEIKMGVKDTLSFSMDRRKEYVNHLTGGDKTVKFGVVTSAYEVRAGKNAGQLKVARTMIAELAADKLK